ncbi:NPCBM/NEW2 domain-containing protein [Paenibacillus sp. CAU 1782]
MKDKLKGLVVGILVGTMITGGSVFAANKMKIEVNYENLKYMVDGVEKKPSIGQGFIYDGTTYVPLRFAGEALGKDVNWDGKTKTIWIGKKEGNFKYLSEIDYSRAEGKAIDYLRINEWKNPPGQNFNIAGQKYFSGLGLGFQGQQTGKVSYNLNGNYSKLSALLGIDDSTKNSVNFGRLTIVGDGVELFKSDKLIGGDPAKEISVDLSGVLKLEILFEGIETDAFGSYADYLNIVFAEAKLFQ